MSQLTVSTLCSLWQVKRIGITNIMLTDFVCSTTLFHDWPKTKWLKTIFSMNKFIDIPIQETLIKSSFAVIKKNTIVFLIMKLSETFEMFMHVNKSWCTVHYLFAAILIATHPPLLHKFTTSGSFQTLSISFVKSFWPIKK